METNEANKTSLNDKIIISENVISHLGWREERCILYKGVETSP